MTVAELRTLRGVELLRTGAWRPSAGPKIWNVARADLESAAAAFHAGVGPVPVAKVGHTADDTQPAVGVLANLRLAPAGDVLLADLVGVDADLADQLGVRWPNRSVEAMLDYTDHTGRTWPLVIEAVALLSGSAPAVKGLKALPEPVAAAARRVSLTDTRRPHIIAATARLDTRAQAVKVAAARRRRIQRSTRG